MDNQSLLINSFFKLSNKLLNSVSSFHLFRLFQSSSLILSLKKLPWKLILIFLFVLALPIGPTESDLQLTTVTTPRLDSASVLNNRQFGINISLSIILFLPLIMILIYQYYKRKSTFLAVRLEILLFLFLALAELSTIFSFNIQASLVWLLKLIYGLMVYLVFSRLTLAQKDLRGIIYALVGTIVFEAIITAMQFVKGGLIGIPIENAETILSIRSLIYINDNPYFRTIGTFSHPNLLSAYIGILLPVSIVMIFHQNITLRLISIMGSIAGVMIIIATLSRWGAAIAIFSILITFVLIIRINRPHKVFWEGAVRKFIIWLFILMTLTLFNPFIINRFVNFSLDDESLNVRIELIRQAQYTIQYAPLLGIGGGNFPIFFTTYDFTDDLLSQRFPASVHNTYLLVTSELGFFGLLLLLAIIAEIMRNFMKGIRSLRGEHKLLAIGLFVCFLTFVTRGVWEPRLFTDRVGLLFFFLVGLLINILSQHRKTSSYQ